jgi:hypothetical protein
MMLCRKCGTRLTVIDADQEYHPNCIPEHTKLPGTSMSLYEMELKEEMLEFIQWTNFDSPRSRQVLLGCSEAGVECDRRIAYSMIGHEVRNFPDPLKALMGTAFHHLMDDGVRKWQEVHNSHDWLTETEVWPAKFLKGHVDLYSKSRKLVLDWKTTSAEILKKWAKEGIPQQYLIQVMLYGKGIINAGYEVERVGLVGVSRSGTLRDVQVLTLPYDPQIVIDALRRVWQIGKTASELDLENASSRFAEIPATPSYMTCSYCPFYRGGTRPADGTGCPGKNLDNTVDGLFN